MFSLVFSFSPRHNSWFLLQHSLNALFMNYVLHKMRSSKKTVESSCNQNEPSHHPEPIWLCILKFNENMGSLWTLCNIFGTKNLYIKLDHKPLINCKVKLLRWPFETWEVAWFCMTVSFHYFWCLLCDPLDLGDKISKNLCPHGAHKVLNGVLRGVSKSTRCTS